MPRSGAKKIGYGGSDRSAGLVNAGMWLPPAEVELKLGKNRGSALLKQLGEAPGYLFTLIERFEIRCEARRTGTIHAAHASNGFKDLEQRVQSILPGGQGLWDTGRIMFSLRRDNFNRLIIGSMGTLLGGSRGLSERWAAQMLKRLFPNLGPCKFKTSWFGKIAIPPDHLPRFHRFSEGLYTPIG